MANYHLSMNNDKYQIFIDNSSQENTLSNNEISTASNFIVTLNSSVDLSSLLYLKSSVAEMSLSALTIDNIALTYSSQEYLKVTVQLPEDIGRCNLYFQPTSVRQFNETPYIIPLDDYSTANSEDAVFFINKRLTERMTFFLLHSVLRIVFDTDIFEVENKGKLTLKDIRLINRYLDCIIFSRHILHRYLGQKLGSRENEVDSLVTFQGKENVTSQKEQQIIKESEVIRPVNLREKPTHANNMDLSIFGGVNLNTAYTQTDGPRQFIETESENWLTQMEAVERIDPTDAHSRLTEESEDMINGFLDANKCLIQQAIQARQLITFEKDRLDRVKTGQNSLLFNDNLICLTLDDSGSRLKCELNPSLFLVENTTRVWIQFPRQVSYVMGTQKGDVLTIGPIVNDPNLDAVNEPKLTNTITCNGQRLHSGIRAQPRLLYIVTDLASSLRRDLWLQHTPFEDSHIIHCHVMDENTISSRFICKTNEHEVYYRVSTMKNLLNKFKVFILDENFRLLIFPLRTYCRLSLTFRPVSNSNN